MSICVGLGVEFDFHMSLHNQYVLIITLPYIYDNIFVYQYIDEKDTKFD